MATPIEVFEHRFIGVGDLDDRFRKKHLDLLEKFHEKQKRRIKQQKEGSTFFDLAYQNKKAGIKFKQYVGVLTVKDLCFYVWPKADRNGDNAIWKDHLLFMLAQVYKLKVDTIPAEKLTKRPHTLLNIFIKKFIDEVAALLNRGLIKTYRKTEGNRTVQKGKMLFNKQIAYNCAHQERFYVKYTTYDYNHILNRILRQALLLIPSVTTSSDLKGKAASLFLNFPELPEIEANPDLFQNLVYDRKSEDYREAIRLAEMILLNFMPDLQHGGSGVWALMFDMNKLWEEFVFCTLKRKLTGYEVRAQKSEPFWECESFEKTKIIKPDIVLSKGKETFVLDTKWKIPFDNNKLQPPSDSDLHQLYVYLNRFNAQKGALVYPGENQKVVGKYYGPTNSFCDMLFLPGQVLSKTMEQEWQKAFVDCVRSWVETEHT